MTQRNSGSSAGNRINGDGARLNPLLQRLDDGAVRSLRDAVDIDR